MSIRCFIAIELEEGIHKNLAQLQSRLQKKIYHDSKIRWVKPHNIHLTLKFLGDVDDTAIPEVCTAVSQAAALNQPFDFEIGNCGSFGSGDSARVLWIGVTGGHTELEKLHHAVNANLADIGFSPDRRKFNPHLTLARIRNAASGRNARKAVDQLEPTALGGQSASEITVFQSVLTSAGPIYTPLHHVSLQ